MQPIGKRVSIELMFTGLVLGGLPENPEALIWINKKREEEGGKPSDMVQPSDLKATPVPGTEGVVEDEEVEVQQREKLIFRKTPDGKCAIDEHTIKGIVRESLRLQELSRKGEWKGLADRIHTDPYLLPFVYEKEPIFEARAYRVRQMGQPPRSVVSIHEAIVMPTLAFILEIHDANNKRKVEDLRGVFEYAGRYIGIGAGRSKSGLLYHYGLFKLTKFDILQEAVTTEAALV